MQTKLLNTIFVFILLLFVSTNLRAASYTWAGGTSSWSTSGSWSSPGIPGTGDNVTINAGGTYTISLTGNSTIANLTVSGTYAVLNLGGYTLTVTGTATFDKGAINNGSLNISNGSATTTFSGTTFGANLTVTSGNIIFSGSVFNGTLIADKTGTGTSTGNGGNIFNAPVTLIKSGTGPFTLSNNSSLPDTFNSTLHIIQCTSGNFYIAHQGIGNVFNDEVTFSSRGGGNIHCNYYGTSTFNDAIIIDSLACNLFFGFGSGSCTQTAGHRILAGANGFTEGTAHFRGFTQNGTTDTVNLTVTGTGKIYFEEGSVWNSPIIESMPGVGWTGARFNAPVTFIQTVGGGGSGGGSYFAASATIKNASSLSFGTGSAAAQDTFASDALLELVSYRFYLNGAVFLGNTTLKNNLTGGLGFHASNIGDVVFKGNVTLIGSGGTWDFGFAGGTTLLDNGAKLILGSPFSGNITLDHFTQVGSDTINFTGTSRLALASDNGFDGPFIYSGVNFWSNGTTFNNSVNITRRLATSANISDGGNVFNGAVTITDSSLSARHLTFANLYPDTFNAAVTFIEKGPNTTFIQPAYGANSVFKGNVTVQGTAAIPFGANGGKVIFAGGANQTLNKTGSFGPTFKKVEVNKSAGYLKLNVPVTLTTDSFFLTSGALITDATNILTVPDNGIVITTTAHTGYVHGPVKKSGNDAFEFPLGDTTLQSYAWHPLSIGAPSVTGVSFTALYTSADHGHGTNAEPAIEQVSTCEYWDISRSGGSAADSIKVTLTWNHSCNAINPADMRVAYWDVTPTPDIWGDKGNSAYTGNSTVGSVTSQYKLTAFGHFALADKVCTTLLVSATSTATTCYVGGNGRATATATLGTSPYTYSWTTGATTATITGLSANTYTATVTDVHGCTTTATATVTQPSPFSVVIENDEPVCAGGVLELDPDLSGGVGSSEYFSFSWTGPASFTSASPRPTIVDADLTTANSGTYSVTVTDVTGCTATASKAITVHPAIIASLGSNTPVCTGQTLQLTSTASAGTAPYTYNWQGFGGNSFSSTAMSPSISNIALTDEGNYQLIIIDQAGCGAGGQTTVVVNPAVTISSGSNSPNCGSSLQLTSSASAGTTPYAFAWTGPASFSSSSANPVITNAQPVNVGTYSVTVTDNKGCTALSTTVPGILQIPLVTLGSNSRVCDGSDLSLTSSVSGGVTPYTYAWTGPNSYTSSSANPIVSLPSTDASGYYHLSVSDHNGCVSVDSTNAIVRALPYAALFISGDNSICNGTSITIGVFLVGEGDITGTLDDGTPFTGFIGPLDFGQTFTDILVSPTTNTTYRMTSLHDLYCDTDPYFLSDPLNYVDVIVHNSLSLSATTVSCHGGDGAATITPSGGTAPYTYLWNTGATIQTITGLSAGTYSVNVTDAVGCSPTKIVTITTDASLAASITPSTNISCYGSNNGTATVSPSGGSSPYTYLWNNSSTQVSITGLSPSTYSVTVTDHRGCTTSAGVTITQPAAALSASVPSSTDVTCYAGSNGTATASQSGGTSPYTYLWSNSSTSSSVSGLPASTYSVTVTDHNGCTATATATVTQPAALIASLSSQTNVSCYGGSDGAVTVSSDGASPFTYLWSNSATTSSISGVTAATYSVVITDTHGCTATTTATITQPAVLSASIPSQTNVSCYGGSNGTATASQSGGTSPFNYLWSNSATASSISGLIASSYSVIVTDHNGCTATATATITQPASALVASVPSLTDVSCYGGSNGTATASQSGGTSPYTYLWNNSAITSSVSGLPASTYSVTVTDHNGCTSTATATVSQPSALSASITSYTDVNCATVTAGTATVAGSGGSGSNTYAWSNGSTSQTASSLATGTYTVTVTDAHGCTATTSVTISSTGTTTYTISVNSNSPVCETYSDIELSSSVSGGASPYNYTWTGPGSFSSASANPVRSWPILSDSGYYHLSVTDAHGCVSGDNSTKVEMHALPNVGLYIDGDNFICNGNSIEIQVFVVGSGAINGSFDDGTAFSGNIGPLDGGFIIIPVSVSPTTSTTYRFLYLNDETCDADPNIIADVSNYVDVIVNELPTLSIVGRDTIYRGENDTLTAITDASPATYLWSTGATTSSIIVSPTTTTTYSLTVTNSYSCSVINSSIITIQYVDFVESQDTIYVGDTLTLTNISDNFPSTQEYVWLYGKGCLGPDFDPLVGSGIIECSDTVNGLNIVSLTYPVGDYEIKLKTFYNGQEFVTLKHLTVLSPTTPSACFTSNCSTSSPDLIYNGGFEQYNWPICDPYDYGRLNWEFQGNFFPIPAVCAWSSTNQSILGKPCCQSSCGGNHSDWANVSPDYFMSHASQGEPYNHCGAPCGNPPNFVPNNQSGCQSSYNGGNAYVGIVAYKDNSAPDPGYREFIEQKLVSKLIKCQTYVLRFRIALSEWSGYAVNGIGAGFSNKWEYTVGTYTPCGDVITSYIPPIPSDHRINLTPIISSKDWVLVEGCYEAFGDEEYIVIGDFLEDIQITKINNTPQSCSALYPTNSSGHHYAYYYIDSVTLRRSPGLDLSASITKSDICMGICNGKATAHPGGCSSAPYTYSWNNGQTTQTITGLCSGTYTVVIADAKECTASAMVVIIQPPILEVSLTSSSSCAGTCKGTITATPSGGSSPYTYSWTNGQTVQTVTGLCSGTYSVIVTDMNGCTITRTITIIQPSILSVFQSHSSISCHGLCDGSATVTPSGGTSPYTYSWNTGSTTTTASTSGLCAGTYSVRVTDTYSCSATATYTITEPDPLTANITITSNSCTGTCTAKGEVIVTGGTPVYHYSWNPGGQTTQTVTGLCAGTYYTATITDAHGCTAVTTNTYTIIDASLPTITAHDYVDACTGMCNGTASVISASGSGTYTYSWTPGGQTTQTATGLCPGTYSVKVTDGNICSVTQTFTISFTNDIPAKPIISGQAWVCDGWDQIYSISNYNSADCEINVYDDLGNLLPPNSVIGWEIGLPLSPDQFIVHWQNSNGGKIVVSVKTSTSCYSTSVFYVQPCCPTVNPGVGYNDQSSAFLDLHQDQISDGIADQTSFNNIPNINQSITINGILDINSNLKIKGNIHNSPYINRIFMAAGSQIIVRTGVTLEIEDCHLLACNEMWKGIYLEEGANLIMSHTEIDDAENAITANKNSTYILNSPQLIVSDRCYFDRDYNGIKILGNNGSVTGIIGNTIFNGNALHNPYGGQQEYDDLITPSSRSNAGILSYNTQSLNIGTTSGNPFITFQNLNYGVFTVNTNTVISHCTFNNMQSTNSKFYDNAPDAGIGVYSASRVTSGSSKYIRLTGFGTAGQPSFSKCRYGVYLDGSRTLNGPISPGISDNKMTDMREGVVVANHLLAGGVNVSNNNITANFIGINCFTNSNKSIYIEQNFVNMVAPGRMGINVDEQNSPNAYYVHSNLVNMNTGSAYGIRFNRVQQSVIQENNISVDGAAVDGILLTGSNNNIVNCNYVHNAIGIPLYYGNTNGYHGVQSLNNQISCNSFTNTESGFRFQSSNAGSVLQGNDMAVHKRGLQLLNYPQSVIGVQGPPLGTFSNANKWHNSPYQDGGIKAPSSATNAWVFGNQLYFPEPTCSTSVSSWGILTTNQKPTGLNSFFIPTNTGFCNYFDCSTFTCQSPLGGNGNFISSKDTVLDSLDIMIANHSLPMPSSAGYYSAFRFSTNKYLYDKLRNDTVLLADTLFRNFYDSVQTTNIGLFAAIEDSMKALQTMLNSINASTAYNDSIIDTTSSVIRANEEMMFASTDFGEIDSLQQVDSVLFSTIIPLDSVNGALADSIIAIITYQAGAVYELNDEISPDTLHEQNLKTINAICLATVARGIHEFTDEQKTSLASIAAQCPDEGGYAVFIARSLYASVNDSVRYDDIANCSGETFDVDTCHLPEAGGISGETIALCNQQNQTYSIEGVSNATGYKWYLVGSGAVIDGPDTLTSVNIDFSDSISAVTLCVAPYNDCGYGSPGRLQIYGYPKLSELIAESISVCHGDTTIISTSSASFPIVIDSVSICCAGDSLQYSTDTITIIWSEEEGDRTLSLYASNDCGVDSTLVTVNVEDCPARKAYPYNQSSSSKLSQTKMYPNPTKGTITVSFNSQKRMRYVFEVLDLTGRILMSKEERADDGINIVEFDLGILSKGIYFLNVHSNDSNEMLRIVVQ